MSILALVLPVSGARGSDGPPAQTAEELVALAREAASEDRHADAIALALSALEQDPSLEPDTALLIAHQLTWLERPEEAIPWYDKHLKHHSGDREGMLGLARALAWSGDLAGAAAIYGGLAGEDPADEEALVGLAQVRAWRENHAEAARLYGRALEAEPDSREALLGLAAAENARGRHRQAANLYEKVLEQDPGSVRARTGLAQTWYWRGRPDLGESAIEGVAGDEATDLRREMASDRRSVWEAAGSFWTDVDDEGLTTYALRWEGAARPRTRLRAEIAFDRSTQPRPGEIRVVRPTGGASWAASRSVALNLNLTALRQDSGGGDVDVGGGVVIPGEDVESTRLLWDTWATWQPVDWTRIDAGFVRAHIATPHALARRLHVDEISIGFDRRLTDRWIARARTAQGNYSDGNRRWSTSGELETTPWPSRSIALRAGASWFAFDETLDHGYYDPTRYNALFTSAQGTWRLRGGWRFVVDARLASEQERADARFGALDGGVEVQWRGRGPFGVSAFARKSTSRLETSGGYEREGAGLALFSTT
ncbi:MAG: tetratricopeptide repeat protein [bacterium]